MNAKKLIAAIAVSAGLCTNGETQMPEIVSHRGESIDRPENSMAAFRLAFERGVEGVECDVYCTSDGVPVIIHDATTARTATLDSSLTVTSSTWDQLKDVRIGAFGKWLGTEWESEKLPKLEDYLALLSLNATTKCIVELKGDGANNLVAKVVEAVQAQPLAMKDRVAFIAFDASLVSAVRAALPDYDALLLLSNVSDSAATINSKIAACNATGVDIHYQAAAAQSEAAIQAVKDAGYKFWTWTCDDVNESYNLAVRGVQSITTNKGGDTKTAVAAAIAATESNEPVVYQAAPSGAVLMEPSAYVQTGLVGNFDGIRNAGMDLPHDNSATTWKNLASGMTDATFTHRVASSAGHWTDNSYYFNNGTMASTTDTYNLGNNFTVQIAINVSPTGQSETTTSKNNKNSYHAWFNDNPKENRGFWTQSHSSAANGKTVTGNFNLFGDGNYRINMTEWEGKYVTWMLDGANSKGYTFQTDRRDAGMTVPVKKSNKATKHCWGGEITGAGELQAFLKGDYHSVRMYSKALTDDELQWNRIVDEIRYRGAIPNGTVVVDSNRAGAEGTEKNGTYYVNGVHTFTAPESVEIAGCVYAPTGYKLETYDSSTKTWNFVEENAELYFTYSNHAAASAARITWNWRLASGVKKIDADDYVQGGLVLNFDGIRNAGLGTAHATAATVWKNLGSGGDATLSVFDTERSAGAWTANGYDFDAGSCFITDRSVPLERQATVQFAVEYNASAQLRRWPHFFCPADFDSDPFNCYTYTTLSGSSDQNRGDHLRFNTYDRNEVTKGMQPWDGRLACAIIDNARSSITNTAKYAWNTGKYKDSLGSHPILIGAGQKSAASRKDRAYKGVYHAFRLYDRVLTEAEIARNQEIDNMRYYAGAGRYTGGDLVEVACEIPGADFDGLGCWILRGDGASKTFTAPATVVAGNRTYSFTGYRLETWNATKRMWENPVETEGVATVELGAASQNRRLVWLYAFASGIRSAADYDVHDYVQKGLVANYDGIRNLGPGNTHGALSQFWHDSSYRDVNMVAASNTAFNAWIGKGHRFTADEVNAFETAEPLSLGQSATIQAVLDTVPASQPKNYPLYFGFGYDDRSIFTRNKDAQYKTRLEVKYPDWVGANIYCQDWEGKYFTSVVSPTRHYLVQGTELGEGTARTKFEDIPVNKMAIGAPNTYTVYNERLTRSMSGDYYALRIYNRVLTDAELAHNRKVDEIRYRGNFPDANVIVACEPAFEGAATPVSIPAGDYEVAGSWTFTAESVAAGAATLPPRYTIETWDGEAWSAPVEHESASYTYTAGGAKVRLTWKWADPSEAATAVWTGGGKAGNLLDPENWRCVNASGESISAVPMDRTTVIIDGTTTFSVPAGATMFPYKKIQIGGENHTAMRLGSLALNSNAGFTAMQPGFYTIAPAADTALSNLNGGNAEGPHAAWQKKYVQTKRARFDGWINVPAGKAGAWTIRQAFDDFFAFALDDEWLIVNNTYTMQGSATLDVPAGWHRFTIVCGDTTGGFGSTDTCSFTIGGEHVPLSVSCGGEILSFTSGAFELGAAAPATVTLAADADWSAFGDIAIANGAVVDLNGHNLNLSSISSEYLGAVITNSNDEVLSTVTFTAPEGAASTNNVSICGNVKVAKKGAGAYYAYATGCTYTGGTSVDGGTAQPPDGSGENTLYCWDSFKAFGLGEITIASGATFDLRANYAYRDRVVLAGGTLANGKADMKNSTWGGSGIGRLEADSFLRATPYSIVFGDNSATKGGDMDLGGHTLTVNIDHGGKYLYLRCSKIENGKIDIQDGGWLQVVNPCDARTVDFKIGCALNMANMLNVRDYEAIWTSNNTKHNAGTAAMNVYGTFKPNPSHDRFYGCTMQNGSTIDLSGRTGAFSTKSSFTTGSNYLKFAAGATITVKLAGRTDLLAIAKSDTPYVMRWNAAEAPGAGVAFKVDDATKSNRFKVVRDDENNALRLVFRPGFAVLVR